MFSKQARRATPAVNAGSMADIAFLLLIFFLVTTTILQEEGVLVRLPVWENDPPITPLDQDKVLTVALNRANALLVEGELAALEEVADLLIEHLERPEFPANEAVVSLIHDRGTNYESYLKVYDALLAGYHRIRDKASLAIYGKNYDELDGAKQKEIREQYPLVLSEAEPTDWDE
ncbi:biopolymer transporter ExbD [Lewinellaceae bacterium SD302]|nr:biopolymer transporter ExbD [Lewinellaceae bacterium SD302]